MGGEEQETSVMADGFDLLAGDHGGHRQTRAEGLGQREQVRHDSVRFEGVHRPGAPDPGLRLVDDQQHAALVAHLLEPAQVPRRGLDDPA